MVEKTTAETIGYFRYDKATGRSFHLAEMWQVVRWGDLNQRTSSVELKRDNGCLPVWPESLLRIYFLRQSFNLPKAAVMGVAYDRLSKRRYVGIVLGYEPKTDGRMVRRLRHRPEKHVLGRPLFNVLHSYPKTKEPGTVRGRGVGTSVISAPSSSSNTEKERVPYINQTRMCNWWHLSTNADGGVDSKIRAIQEAVGTTAGSIVPAATVGTVASTSDVGLSESAPFCPASFYARSKERFIAVAG